MRAALILPFLLTACSGNPAPVTVAGARADLDRLAGEWVGEYHSPQTGRSGSITFTLTAGTDSAWGDVVMVPAGGDQPLRRAPMQRGEAMAAATPQVLTIRFVRVDAGVVSGVLDPYTDPACGCTVLTAFSGHMDGDRIRGEFVSRHTDHPGIYGGTWSVTRRR